MATVQAPLRLALPRSYFEVMTENGIVVVYRGRVYTPLVAPSPDQLAQYGQASLRLGGLVFALEPMERLATLEQRYFNGRSLQPALQQYQQDYLASLGGQMVSADLQDEILSVALKRFITDDIFPSFATSQRSLDRLIRVASGGGGGQQRGRQQRDEAGDNSVRVVRDRSNDRDDGVPRPVQGRRVRDEDEEERVRRLIPGFNPADENETPPPSRGGLGGGESRADNTAILRGLLRQSGQSERLQESGNGNGNGSANGGDRPPRSERRADDDSRFDHERSVINSGYIAPEPDPVQQAFASTRWNSDPNQPSTAEPAEPVPPTPSSAIGGGTQSYERNFARLLRHTVTTRNSELTSALPTQQSRPLNSRPVAANPPANGNRPAATVSNPAPRPSAPAVEDGRVQPREQQRGLTQPRGIVSAAPQTSELSIIERLLGLTDFAVIEGVIYALQPVAPGSRPDVQIGNSSFSLRPYAALGDFLTHYNTRVGEILRREGVSNQPVIQQLRRDRQHVEEALKLNYGAMGLSIQNINSRSCFVCMEVPPFANRGSDGKFYYFAAPMLREFARRAGLDLNQVQDAIRVAIQVSINWSARGFEKITAGEPIMLGMFKGPFVSWARELTVNGGYVYNRDICTENYQPPSQLSFGAGIANKLEAAKRITLSGYILGAVRPRSLLNTEGYGDFQVELDWLRANGIQVTNVAV